MEPIELSRWEPSPEDPRRKQYAGQRTAQEVFEELRHRLEGMGYLPDEYFLMNRDWENGREIPRGADIFCTTDYGGSEGIYLDVSLQWYENDRTVTRNFITGKTLGETGADLDRMFLISSAITKAFHGDRGTYARYLSCGEQPEPEAMIVHLDPAEQRTIIQALVEQRERQEQAMSQTEQLLRRMTGSITAYMEEVGQRPLRMSDYDKTVLAIQDGELTEFWARYPKALDQADSLLVETAGRPGAVGRRMTLSILSAATKISPSAYLTACKRAVDTGDGQRVQSLIEQAESCLSEPLPALTGVAILHAYTNGHRNMAKDLIAQCTSEQIAAALLCSNAMYSNETILLCRWGHTPGSRHTDTIKKALYSIPFLAVEGKSLFLLSLLAGARLAQAEQHHGAVLHDALLVAHQLHHLLFVHVSVHDATAAVAVEVAVPAQSVVEAVSLARDGDAADAACIYETVEVAVDGTKAQAGTFLGCEVENLLGSRVVAELLHFLQYQLALFGITHGLSPFYDGVCIGIKAGFRACLPP